MPYNPAPRWKLAGAAPRRKPALIKYDSEMYKSLDPTSSFFMRRNSVYYKTQFDSKKEAEANWREHQRWWDDTSSYHINYLAGIRIPTWCHDGSVVFKLCTPEGEDTYDQQLVLRVFYTFEYRMLNEFVGDSRSGPNKPKRFFRSPDLWKFDLKTWNKGMNDGDYLNKPFPLDNNDCGDDLFEKPYLGFPNDISTEYIEEVIDEWKSQWYVLKHREEDRLMEQETVRADASRG